MGFTLDQNTIRELAATIASEVVKTLSEAQLVNDTRAAMAKNGASDSTRGCAGYALMDL